MDDILNQIQSGQSFDSSDVISRLNTLNNIDAEDMNEYEREERDALAIIATEAENATAEWDDGAAFIPESQFEDYARELAYEIGAVDADTGWPTDYIDWPAAANALKEDYMAVDICGTTYYAR